MKKTLVVLIIVIMTLSLLGGCKKVDNKSITLVSREDGSGTRGAFVDLFKIEEKVKGHTYDRTYERAEITNSTSVMMTTVAGDESAIGYISLGVLNSTVKALKINGVEANEENIKSGKYNIVRQFNIVVKDDLNKVAKDFIDYIMSKEGQDIVSKERYVSIKTKKYKSKKPKGKISIAGSSSVAPLMEALVEEYKKINENAVIELQQNDSTTGINSTIEGICDIGMSSRELKDKELRSGIKSKVELDEIVEKSLRSAAIWDEVKDRLKKSALGMSGGQQQRLCIARALAVEPEVLLMDEPTSALDPISTSKIEELVLELKDKYTIVMVTHNMQQAVRVADKTAFFLSGEIVEYDDTDKLFSMPSDKRTEDYITGRFG